MEFEHQHATRWIGYVDWRNRPALRGKHGGMIAASFVLVVEILENLSFLANASNLVLYLRKNMHFSPSKSANNVTNFMGTAFLLALLGGFLSDAFFTTYRIYLISAVIEFLGLIILTTQASVSSLQPPACDPTTECEEVNGAKALMLFAGLYLVALGAGGIKGSLAPHGAEQFDENSVPGRKHISTFFNYFVFCLSCGGLIAVTFVVWIEDNIGWKWGFGIATISMFLSIPVFLAGSTRYKNKIPTGSPLTTILKVLAAATMNKFISRNSSSAVVNMTSSPLNLNSIRKQEESSSSSSKEIKEIKAPSTTLKFLNSAIENESIKCSVEELEDVKIVLKILPIFCCTIVLNCCLAQLSTFSVEQAATMNTKIGSLKVPPASLPIFPIVFIMILAPIYDHIIIPFARKYTNSEMGITHLQRIGFGLILSIISMAVAALVEVKRKRVATDSNLLDDHTKPIPISFFWIAFQFLFLGSADLFTMAGLLEFFFTEAPVKMRSWATSLTWTSLAIGYYLSSVIISIVNSVTGNASHKAWLSGSNLNHYHLERFYWVMCVLSGLNFLHYLFWAIRYKYRGTGNSQ
ncbi:protein NRT1/ PTR FAMILY 4.6-like [Vicia villosa]|uniref:protein NRT1/ PTR FAMILY 4.6-like n=1 Tax=Vicia villosa TaxID=3911 RepID=UPI00273AF6F3|nr:protein NRT1/ PTR FAMILY 4.6-like [Vicia villosa]